MSDLEGLKPGRLRRDYLDDMTVVVVRLHTSVPLCVCACVSVCLRLCICVCVVKLIGLHARSNCSLSYER